jgi:uncharacterized protein YjbI with pentapeptide repeats
MNPLSTRWQTEPEFQMIYKMILDRSDKPAGMDARSWYETSAPKVPHVTSNGTVLDCRHAKFDGLLITDKADMSWCALDGSSVRGCTFDRTLLQSSLAADCDFTDSRFVKAQMSPFYAPRAIFKDCVFEGGFVMGIGPRHIEKGAFSDLRECDFSGVQAKGTGFDRCDFTGAKLRGARFVGCRFDESDLRGVDLSGASFQACDLVDAQMDDTPAAHALVEQGSNLNVDSIRWSPPA